MKDQNFSYTGKTFLFIPDIAKAISRALKFAHKGVINTNINPEWHYICFHIRQNLLTIVATDGYLAYISETFELKHWYEFDRKHLLSLDEARNIVRIGKKHVMYVTPGVQRFNSLSLPGLEINYKDLYIYCVRKVPLKFPDYTRFIPMDAQIVTLDTAKLKGIMIELMGKLKFGNPYVQAVGKQPYNCLLKFDYSNLEIMIWDTSKGVMVSSRHIQYVEDQIDYKYSKHTNLHKLDKVIKALPDNKNVSVSIAISSISFASEGTKETIFVYTRSGTNYVTA